MQPGLYIRLIYKLFSKSEVLRKQKCHERETLNKLGMCMIRYHKANMVYELHLWRIPQGKKKVKSKRLKGLIHKERFQMK